MKNNNPFAEIIESSLQYFLAQSWQWNEFPSFGSLVTVTTKKRELFGIVHHIQTGSMDPMRYPFAYKKTEEELMQEQPQIFEFLKTTFSCITIGYKEKGQLFSLLSPEPPTIHALVSPTDAPTRKQLLSSDNYLHMLFGASNLLFNIDELLLAMLKQQAADKTIDAARLSEFVGTFSLLTGNDYRRLKLFLSRAQPLLER